MLSAKTRGVGVLIQALDLKERVTKPPIPDDPGESNAVAFTRRLGGTAATTQRGRLTAAAFSDTALSRSRSTSRGLSVMSHFQFGRIPSQRRERDRGPAPIINAMTRPNGDGRRRRV
jgi:hypothetical protein